MFNDDYDTFKDHIEDWLKRADLTTDIPSLIHLAELNIEQHIGHIPNKNDSYYSSGSLTAGLDYIFEPFGCIEPIFLRLETDPIRELTVVSYRELARLRQVNTSGIPQGMIPAGPMKVVSFGPTTNIGGAANFYSEDHGLVAGDWVWIKQTANYDGKGVVSAAGLDSDNFRLNGVSWVSDAYGIAETFRGRILFDCQAGDAYDYTLFYRANFTYLHNGDDNNTTWLLQNFPNALLYGTLTEAQPFIKNDARIPVFGTKFTNAVEAIKLQQWRRRASGGEKRVKVDFAIP